MITQKDGMTVKKEMKTYYSFSVLGFVSFFPDGLESLLLTVLVSGNAESDEADADSDFLESDETDFEEDDSPGLFL